VEEERGREKKRVVRDKGQGGEGREDGGTLEKETLKDSKKRRVITAMIFVAGMQ